MRHHNILITMAFFDKLNNNLILLIHLKNKIQLLSEIEDKYI